MEGINEETGLTGREIRCEACGCAFVPEMLTEKDDGIEYHFFRCGYCGKAYMVCVTDEELREGIREYLRLAGLNKLARLDEPAQFKMQAQKACNAEREVALRKTYLKEVSNG